jgi:hypothetical protein
METILSLLCAGGAGFALACFLIDYSLTHRTLLTESYRRRDRALFTGMEGTMHADTADLWGEIRTGIVPDTSPDWQIKR